MQETKKAFRQIYKKQDLNAALVALCNLKGVGPAMASGNAHFPSSPEGVWRGRRGGVEFMGVSRVKAMNGLKRTVLSTCVAFRE